MQPAHAELWWRIAVAALLVAVVLVWLPALPASFQFDDWNVIVYDAHVQSLAAWAESMPGIRPVLKLSYALNHSLSNRLGSASGGDASGLRCVNLLLHLCNVWLVATLLRRRDAAAALLATTIFALHPVQTEAVTYVSGRSVALAALFSLFAIHAWLKARGVEGAARRGPALRWRVAAVLSFVLALGCKETALVVPLLLWLWIATEPGAAPPAWREFSGFAVGVAVLLLLALTWQPYRHLLATDLAVRPIALNLLTQSHALFYLLGQWLWPAHLNADPQLAAVAAIDAGSCVLLALWLLLVVVAMRWRRRYPQFAFGALWFLICLLPTNSLVPRPDVANDRQLYLALLGPAWCLCVPVARALGAWRPAAIPVAARVVVTAGVLGVVLAFATLSRNRVYANEIVFWQDVVRNSPSNARAFNNLGMAYALACRDADATAQFRQSLALQAQDSRAAVNLRLLQSGELAQQLAGPSGLHCETPPRKPAPAN